MITRAVIEDIDYKNNKIKVRIPILDGIADSKGSTPKTELNWASVVCIPGLDIEYRVGDVVIVGFEDNDLGKPIVLGYLKLALSYTVDQLRGAGEFGASLNDPTDRLAGNFKTLKATESFDAPTDSIIGKTDYSSIFNAINDKENS